MENIPNIYPEWMKNKLEFEYEIVEDGEIKDIYYSALNQTNLFSSSFLDRQA